MMLNGHLPPVIREKVLRFISTYYRGDFCSLTEFATACEDLAACARALEAQVDGNSEAMR
jgi:hypothetical protein